MIRFNPFLGRFDFDNNSDDLTTLDARYVNVTGDVMTGGLKIAKTSTTAFQVTKDDGSTVAITIDSTNGRLGIGTNPAEKFHLAENNASARLLAKMENTNVSGGSSGVAFQMVGNGVDWSFGTDAGLNGGNNFFIQDNNAGYPPRLIIDSSGNHGIKTDSPGYPLDVNGDINSRGAFRVGGTVGVDGTFTTADLKTVTVTKGIITAIA